MKRRRPAVVRWAFDTDRHIISICHGPAAFLACAKEGDDGDFPFMGYTITAFPDATDRETPEIGYMLGQLTWHFGEKLKALNVHHSQHRTERRDVQGPQGRDRLTDASPFAANALGKLAAETLLAEVAEG
jgi:molecular chaperone Hsp31 and glyoxalase 3